MASNNLQIVGATYGSLIITDTISGLVDPSTQSLTLLPDDVHNFPDTMGGGPKYTVVAYRYGNTGLVRTVIAREDQPIYIQPPMTGDIAKAATTNDQLNILAVAYGPTNITGLVASKRAGSQSLNYSPTSGTDPLPGNAKSFTLVASYDQEVPFTLVKKVQTSEGNNVIVVWRPSFKIISASCGLSKVTASVQNLIRYRTLSFLIFDATFGIADIGPIDPTLKSFALVTQYGDQAPQLTMGRTGQLIGVDYNASNTNKWDRQIITAAEFGGVDVTPVVRNAVTDNTLSFNATVGFLCGGKDPWSGVMKTLSITWWSQTQKQFVLNTYLEGNVVHLALN